ncbi:uncharacterized protein GGS22DRAFT_192022 [Annulohypoxylon maeteangense]|uniref:uncharacterized protein n=1 Tax=Annulohypoxylon maeteangense TaxID=1927788 RepID=UPI002008671A|nr:uncharacterized protein GGS22DRAFT_192022 [Annulohypoxylon maeteangense]KAI0881828.1 hypothetical protein GGS22DRAFT_192022 [Annulohypoxylon maeteangense]
MGVVSSTAGHGGGNNGKDKSQQTQLNGDKQDTPDDGSHSQTLWILIFRGSPRDIQSNRVTELYIVFDENESKNLTIRIQGHHPNFTVEEIWNQPHPRTRPHFYRRLAVATVETSSELDMGLRDAISGSHVNNTESDWTCQSWVGDVLTTLQDARLITVEEGDNALNGMVNYIARAPWQ